MSIVHSRTVKLALSYLDDAESRLNRSKQNDNEFGFDKEAEAILGDEFSKAADALKIAEGNGEDVAEPNLRLLTFHALLAFEATKKWDGRRTNAQYKYIWTKWADRFLATQTQLVAVDPNPINQYNLGLAYYGCNRHEESVTALRVAENSADDDISIQATKLLGKLLIIKSNNQHELDYRGGVPGQASDTNMLADSKNQSPIAVMLTPRQRLPFTFLNIVCIGTVVISYLTHGRLALSWPQYWLLVASLLVSLTFAVTAYKTFLSDNHFRNFTISVGAIGLFYLFSVIAWSFRGFRLPLYIQWLPLVVTFMYTKWSVESNRKLLNIKNGERS